jgi:hypothetical protein
MEDGAGLLFFGEEHVTGGDATTATVVEVEDEVVFKDEVLGGVAEFASGAVDGGTGALQFDEDAHGSFVEFDEEILGPGVSGGKLVGGAEFFVTEPAAEAETFKDFLEGGGVVEDQFDLLADFVTALGGTGGGTNGELVRRGFEGEKGSRSTFLIGGGGSFCADAKELTVLGEPTVGGVEDEIEFMGAGSGGFGAKFGEETKKGFSIVDLELDFSFASHGKRLQE